MDVTSAWYWEGNVVNAVERDLVATGWVTLSKANTHSRERGVDLIVSRSDKLLLVEVKGYPSASYRDPRRSAELKPTNPTSQAQQWYSHALLKGMRLQTSFPEAGVALAFPDFPRYRTLYEQTCRGFQKLGLGMIFVAQNGSVQTFGV